MTPNKFLEAPTAFRTRQNHDRNVPLWTLELFSTLLEQPQYVFVILSSVFVSLFISLLTFSDINYHMIMEFAQGILHRCRGKTEKRWMFGIVRKEKNQRKEKKMTGHICGRMQENVDNFLLFGIHTAFYFWNNTIVKRG